MAINVSNTPAVQQRILVVDDDPSIRLVCSKTLTQAGYAVLEAHGSSEAMTLFAAATEPIHLLLVDLFLPPPDFQLSSGKAPYPRVNGHELVRQALSLGRELRVLMMSSHPIASLAGQGIPLPTTCFLQKPFTVAMLLEQVASALASAPLAGHVAPAITPTQEVQWVD